VAVAAISFVSCEKSCTCTDDSTIPTAIDIGPYEQCSDYSHDGLSCH
jgi:hypothetical protein